MCIRDSVSIVAKNEVKIIKPKRNFSEEDSKQNDLSSNEMINESEIRSLQPKEQKKDVDVVICIDATSSMGPFIMQCKEAIEVLSKKIEESERKGRFGIVAYRDHCDADYTFLTKVCDLTTVQNAEEFLGGLSASGGGDFPEAVFDGLVDVIEKISWKSKENKGSSQIVFHICDAPPHGSVFGARGLYDDGCPCKMTMKLLSKMLNKTRIHYKLLKCSNSVDRMSDIFQRHFKFFDSRSISSPESLIPSLLSMLVADFSSE
eukprot:TRINITY_DN8551_c0_g1_i1.p1 TRINITY_DN8551_c0_g1~~TRINITY_DN8551_c0_g1_i1.p1  ORF type:complete len:275 (-),score=58.63 TRINITY_DN8551_c0_g1_i1:56-838(-)